MKEKLEKIKTERDKFIEMYQQKHKKYDLIKNQLDLVDKRNIDKNEKFIMYKNKSKRLESIILKIINEDDK